MATEPERWPTSLDGRCWPWPPWKAERAERSEAGVLGTTKEGLGFIIDFLDFNWDFIGFPYSFIIDFLGFPRISIRILIRF